MLRRIRQMLGGKPTKHVVIEEKAPGQVTIKSPGVDLSVSLPYPSFPKQEPPPPIVLDSPACPYCGVIQDPPPTRRKKCRDCKETIHTWTNQETRRKYLLTLKDRDRIRREEWDAEWKVLNSQVIEGVSSGDWHSVKMAYFRQALMLFQKGGDHQRLALESRKSELRYYQNFESYQRMGVTRVTISTAEEASCAECRSLQGKDFGIHDALELMPIPVHSCQTWADKNEYGGWCRCSYNPVIPRK